MRELLIRYLLGELEQDEQQNLQRQLAASPELRRELSHLRSCFAAANQADDLPADPPRGLAERTSERVAGYDCGGDERPDFARSTALALAGAADPPAGALGWSLADLTVAGGVMLAVSMLLFPALRNSRDETRRNVCQNNQRQLWLVVSEYMQAHDDYVPPVQPHENAGIFTVRLVEGGYIRAEDLAVLLVCPAAPLADSIRADQIEIPTSAELGAMSASELATARQNMSPFFAYRLPYRIGQQYHQIRANRLTPSPLFSDTSGAEQDGLMSPNHGGSIVQVIDLDGSLKSIMTSTAPEIAQDLFRNDLGMVAAGLNRQDWVLGGSEATPANVSVAPGR